MPIIRTVPKRGFSAKGVPRFQVVNVGTLEGIPVKEAVDIHVLKKARLVRSLRIPVKILGNGELKRALNLKVNAASRSALEKIKKAGGTCTLIRQVKKSKLADTA